MLAMLPFCGVFGLNGALAAFAGGAPVVLMDAFDGERAARLAQDHRVTHTFGSDEMYQRMADAVSGAHPSQVRACLALAPSHPALMPTPYRRGRAVSLWSVCMAVAKYWRFSRHNHSRCPSRPASRGGGRPIAGVEATVRVRDTASGELLLPGQSGELEILAPGNFIGYFEDAEATAGATTPDGYFRTGDLGHLRGDGTFVYETRMGT